MNTTLKIFLLALLAGTISGTGQAGTPKKDARKPVPPPAPACSIFILPTNASEGRDPFFPESPRIFEAAVRAQPSHKVDATSLVIKGISGTPGHFFVVINNHAFAAGDEGEVLTSNGRAQVHCVEIRSHVVVVEINGQKAEITFNLK